MPPILAAILTLGFMAFLFRREFRARPAITPAFWLPFTWFFLISTRTFAQWLETFRGGSQGTTYEEGTPLDAVVFLVLILMALRELSRRQFSVGVFARDHQLLFLFLIYSLISVLWSDFAFVSFKRWFKIIGHPVMVMVLLSEPNPMDAITQLMKRCAIIVFPVSILFIKYFPEWGRGFDPFVGLPMNIGIALDKNMLGSVCMVLGAFLFWHLLRVRRWQVGTERSWELRWTVVLLAMCAWVLFQAHSATSLVTMLLAMACVVVLGIKRLDKRKLGTYIVVSLVVAGLAQWIFSVSDMALALLGKDATLTDRTKVWSAVLQVDVNPIFGTGFESFWLGWRREQIWAMYWWHPIQSHDGYLETYLNLGLIGLAFMLGLMWVTFQRAKNALVNGDDFARFRLGFLIGYVLYNVTEAAFKALHPVWFVFFIVLMAYPQMSNDSEGEKLENDGPVVDTGLSETGGLPRLNA
jgi:O-antigen ligase